MSENSYQPSPLAAVHRVREDERWVLVLSREFAHPINRVWEALTEPGQLRRWAPFSPARDLAATGDVVLTMLDGGDGSENVEQSGRVLESEPPRLLVVRWGDDVLRWELTGTEDGVLLVLRHSFDDETMVSSFAAGWHLCLDAADALMKGVPYGPVVGRAAMNYGWDELNERYAEVLDVKPAQS
jgi:uncharacterized protein YndB with AHSA1/START domain